MSQVERQDFLRRAAIKAASYAQSQITMGRQGYRTDASGFVSMVMGGDAGFGTLWPSTPISAAEDTGFCFPNIELDDDPDCWYYPGPEVAHSGHW